MRAKQQVLDSLDACAKAFTFPALDNGYVYLAASRMSLYRSVSIWGLVIEVFGHNPRAGSPDTAIYTFSDCLVNRSTVSSFVSEDAYRNFLSANPQNEFQAVFPVGFGASPEQEFEEIILPETTSCSLRGRVLPIPSASEVAAVTGEMEEVGAIAVYELCRWLAHHHRSAVLATEEERRFHLPPELDRILTLDEWRHPDITGAKMPSDLATFSSVADVLLSGDVEAYTPEPANTHWKNWPGGGTL